MIPQHGSSWPARVGLALFGVLAVTARPDGAVLRAGEPPPVCRTYATSSTMVTKASGFSFTRKLECAYDSKTNQMTCTMTLSTCGVVPFVLAYASLDDFISETQVIPPRMLQRQQTTSRNACNITDQTFAYDEQKRLLKYTMNGLTYAYSSWDDKGRPLRGVITGPGPSTSESWSYDDAARTATLIQRAGGETRTVYTYDANGNAMSVVVNDGASTSTFTVTGTAQVCK